ncbi:unnamed protein product, partial [Rotaria magnacalcarata]
TIYITGGEGGAHGGAPHAGSGGGKQGKNTGPTIEEVD